MTFQEAEARFQWLEGQLRAGAINEQQYRTELNLLRVTDTQRRLWMLQERSGQWHMYQDGRWVPATPPRPTSSPPPPPPASMPPVSQAKYTPQPAQAKKETGGCLRTVQYLIIWAVFWSIVMVVVYLIWGKEQPMIIPGLGLAALLSLLLMLASLAPGWKGQIVEFRTQRVQVRDGDGDSHWENRTIAYIRQTNGRMRKEQIGWNKWQVGDWLEKRRGDMYIRKL